MHTLTRSVLLVALGLAVLAACGTPEEPQVRHELTVTLAGDGTGNVSSDPTGIDTAAGTMTANFVEGTTVVLAAIPDTGSVVAGFSFPADPERACETGSTPSTCILTLDESVAVTATFGAGELETAELTVAVNAAAESAGHVLSTPSGIDTAAGDTVAEFEVGTAITLTATATAGGFVGWSGDVCDGLATPTCSFTIGAGGASVVANFDEVEFETLVLQISANSDDAEEFLADSLANPTRWPEGYTYVRSPDLEIGYDPQHGPQAVGLRFEGVTIPAGATIVDAVLTFTAYSNPAATVPGTGSTGSVALSLTGEASAASATFSDDPNAPDANPPSFGITSRTRTGASVAWTIDAPWAADMSYPSPDVGSIVSEIIGLAGWASGGALTFVLEPTDVGSTEWRRAYAHNTDPARAAILTIRFETP